MGRRGVWARVRASPKGHYGAWTDADTLFPDDLAEVYRAFRERMFALSDDVVEGFAETQVSNGTVRKFAWLTPLTKTKALLLLDLLEERDAPLLRNVIRYRDDKFSHRVEIRAAADVDAVAELGWFDEAASWGRKER